MIGKGEVGREPIGAPLEVRHLNEQEMTMRRIHFAALILAALLAAPTIANAQAAEATVICKDGTTSKGGKGACSGHGGVDKKATKASKEPAGAATKPSAASSTGAAEETTVVCKDGTTSKGGRGACRGHGGVDKSGSRAGAKAAPPAGAATSMPSSPPAATTPPPTRPTPVAPAAAPAAAPAPAAQAITATKASAAPNAKNTDPTGAIAKCKDGTYSHAKGHTGACSRHGGVAEWLDKPAK